MVESVLVNLEDGGGKSGLRQLLHSKADGGCGAREPAIGHRLAHSWPSLGCEQFGGGTIVERAGHASCTPSRCPAKRARADRCREPRPPVGSNALASHEKGTKPN